MTKTDIAYAAGLFDGEGHLEPQGHRTLQASIINTNVDMMEWLEETFGGVVISNGDKRANRAPCFHWRLPVEESLAFLKLILTYSVAKKHHIANAIGTRERYLAQRASRA